MIQWSNMNIKLKLKECFDKRHIMLFFIYVLGLAVGACLAVYLMWGVYLIPVNKIRNNMGNAVEVIVSSMMEVPYSFDGYAIDSFTDSLMLNNASFVGRDAFYDALMNPRVEYGKGHEENLYISLQKPSLVGAYIFEYPRYWHGYLLFLKPLLVFFDLSEIRIINLIFQAGLLLVILYLMYKRLGFKHCVAFSSAMCFINPVTSWMCLEYVGAANVMLLATLWMLLNKNPHNHWMFFVIGAVTILFDWLTFPLTTLCMPLIIYICLYERNFRDNIINVIKNSFLWLSGYAGMWFMKWGLATLLTDQNIFKRAFEKVAERTYGEVFIDFKPVEATVLNSFKFNVNMVCNEIFLFCILASLLLVFINYYFKSEKKLALDSRVFLLLGIGLMPFIWYAFLINHSIIHARITYRILAVTVYALLSAVVCCLEPKKAG